MDYKIDYAIATSKQIEEVICKRLGRIRLARNITQERLADEAGVTARTIYTLENGLGVSFDTFIRVLIALRIQNNLETLLPDPDIRPIERVKINGKERKRASTDPSKTEDAPWSWGDGLEDKDL